MKHDENRSKKRKNKNDETRPEKRSPKAALASRVGLPLDILNGCPYMQLYGGRLLVTEGDCRILAYDENTLSVVCGKYEICIKGRGLCVNMLDKEALAVGGKIGSIEIAPVQMRKGR